MGDHLVFNVEDNRLPKASAAAQREQFLFTNSRMNTDYDMVCMFYRV